MFHASEPTRKNTCYSLYSTRTNNHHPILFNTEIEVWILTFTYEGTVLIFFKEMWEAGKQVEKKKKKDNFTTECYDSIVKFVGDKS